MRDRSHLHDEDQLVDAGIDEALHALPRRRRIADDGGELRSGSIAERPRLLQLLFAQVAAGDVERADRPVIAEVVAAHRVEEEAGAPRAVAQRPRVVLQHQRGRRAGEPARLGAAHRARPVRRRPVVPDLLGEVLVAAEGEVQGADPEAAHQRGGLGADPGLVVDDTRDGLQADACGAGHVRHRRAGGDRVRQRCQ